MSPNAQLLFPKAHPSTLKSVRSDKYVSHQRRSYRIEQLDSGHFYIRAESWGRRAKDIEGTFTTYGAAEKALIQYLRKKDKFGKAIYPGCPGESRINSTGTSPRG